MSLIDQALDLYAKKGKLFSVREIADKTEGAATYAWVNLFINRKIANPGTKRVEAFIKAINELTATNAK